MAAALLVTIGTTCSSVRPSASMVVIVDTRLKRVLPLNMWSSSGCVSGEPAGAGTVVL